MTETSTDNGATPKELLFASCRQHNVDLLREALSHLTSPEAIGEFINTSLDPLGNTALHTASLRGSLEVLDALLDQEGVEVDPRNRLEGDTPLHCAARLSIEEGAEGEAQEVVEMLLEAGADPRIRNKGKLKPIDLVPAQHTELRNIFKRAEMKYMLGYDVVEGNVPGLAIFNLDDDDEGGDSASDDESNGYV